jgi:hypothetical protein
MPLKHFSPPFISDPSLGLAVVALPARYVFSIPGTFVAEVRLIRNFHAAEKRADHRSGTKGTRSPSGKLAITVLVWTVFAKIATGNNLPHKGRAG